MPGPLRRARLTAPSRAMVTTRRRADEGQAPAAGRLLDLQRRCGNRAVGSLLRRPAGVQRDVGWPEATGWNKGAPRTIGAQHKLLRFALAGLAAGNRAESPNPAKTAEKSADKAGARAVVWIHPDLDPAKPVQVVAHLHGLTNRAVDPFAGWRENIADPKTDESDAAKLAALEAAQQAAKRDKTAKRPRLADMPNPLGSKVRDVERDRIGQQIEALGDPQVMAVLPQGTGVSKTEMFGPGFDPNALVDEVLKRLPTESEVTKVVKKFTAAPKNYTIVLSAHSAGGAALASALRGKRTSHVGGLILFDALWGEASKDDPKKFVSPQRDKVLAWVRAGCKDLAVTLGGSKPQTDKDAAVAAFPGVRGFWTGGVYAETYKGLQEAMHAIVDETIPSGFVNAVKAKFRITQAKTTHDRMIGEVGATSAGVAPLQEALSQRDVFVSRQVQRDTPGAKKLAKVELTWEGELKNKVQLQPVLDAHPADLNAEVVERGKVVTTADTTATFEVAASPAAHTFTVVPTATAPGDYFLPRSKKVAVDASATTEATVTLPFNRSNARFTERTWEVEGIKVAKANDVKPATLFGRNVIGGLNALVAAKVSAANTWFTTNVTPAEQTAARASIVSLVGRVKRAQSRGTFSNHSTGVAVDINPSQESLQNWHVKKDDKHHARAMKVFNQVVSQPSVFDRLVTTLAGLLVPGAGDLSAFKGFDVWTERDRDRLLQASERFNDFFPQYLLVHVAKADPARTPAPTAASVMALTKAELTALAAKAKKAKLADVAATLSDIAAVWSEVRAWVGGYVITSRMKGGEPVGMLRRDFDAARAKDPKLTSKGELTGMISIHPAIVKALTESGWSWMVDYKHGDEKDFMHFEDRAAERDLKK